MIIDPICVQPDPNSKNIIDPTPDFFENFLSMVIFESDSENLSKSEVESEAEVVETVTEEGIKKRSWVHNYSEKLEKKGKSYFHCRV
jgi:hypothetical protein